MNWNLSNRNARRVSLAAAVSMALVLGACTTMGTGTGSTVAGRRIASICGERIARYTLELGGKSAAVIMDDYDIETAAASLIGPACLMSGQVCSSLTRICSRRRISSCGCSAR